MYIHANAYVYDGVVNVVEVEMHDTSEEMQNFRP